MRVVIVGAWVQRRSERACVNARACASRVASFPWPDNGAMYRVSLIAIAQTARSPAAAPLALGSVPRVMADRKRTNERSCITVFFSKKFKPSETNDPQCKEDDSALAFQDNVFAIVRGGRTRMRGYVG